MAEILYGAPVADQIGEETAEIVQTCAASGVIPALAVLRYGENASDAAYADSLMRRFQKFGLHLRCEKFSGKQQDDVMQIMRLNQDESVHGILPMQPLPPAAAALTADQLTPEKDVDGVSLASRGMLYSGAQDCFSPCTAAACMEMLRFYGIALAGKRVAVIGRSLVVGRPLAMLLMRADATVTVCHSKTADLPAVLREADIVVAAIGKAEFFCAECFRPGQIVLDVGTNFVNGRQCGDVQFHAVQRIVAAISPVPKGVGTVTTALLMRNTALCALRGINKKVNT